MSLALRKQKEEKLPHTAEFEDRFQKNYDQIRYDFEEELADMGYPRNNIGEVNDGRVKFVNDYRKEQN